MKPLFLKNAFHLSLGEFIGRGIRVVVVLMIARVIGVYNFGIFSYALSLAAFLTIFSDLGISSVLTRELCQKPEDKKKLVSTAIFLKFLLILPIILIVILSPYFSKISGLRPLVLFVILLIFSDSLREIGFSIVRSRQKMHLEAIDKIITNSVIAGLCLWFIFFSPKISLFVLSYLLGSLIGLLFFLFVLRKDIFIFSFKKNLLPYFLKSGIAFSFFGFLTPLMINTDHLLLGYFKNAYQVGVYAAAYRPIQLLLIISTIVSTAFFPSLSKAVKSREKFKEIFKKGIYILVLLAFLLSILGIVFSSQIISLLYGKSYSSSILVFKLLAFCLIFSFPSIFLANSVLALHKQKMLLKYFLFGFLGDVALDIVLIPKWGAVGCAFSTLITLALAVSFLFFSIWREITANQNNSNILTS